MRCSTINRTTDETQVSVSLCLEGGENYVNTGVGFLDHMLTLFAHHGRFGLRVECAGDVQVDDHHSVEDIGICLGLAVKEALGDMRGIHRYGSMLLPMDEALAMIALDISGRGYVNCSLRLPTQKVGSFDTELVEEFFTAFVRTSGITLHIRQLEGKNTHHIIEAVFKGFGRALSQAVAIDADRADEIPSTKGVL